MNLHGDIMNIQVLVQAVEKAVDDAMNHSTDQEHNLAYAYKIGHRDARHAAAELSLSAAPHAQVSASTTQDGWNRLATLPPLETDHCSVGVNFYDSDGAVYQGYCQFEDKLFYWYSYEHKGYIENVRGWQLVPKAPPQPEKSPQK